MHRHLDGNRLTDASAHMLASAEKLSGLHTLSLTSNRSMSREGFRALWHAEHLSDEVRQPFKRRAGIR